MYAQSFFLVVVVLHFFLFIFIFFTCVCVQVIHAIVSFIQSYVLKKNYSYICVHILCTFSAVICQLNDA